MNTINPGDRPLTTSNGILAFCLYLAGIPFLDDRRPLANFYDNDILKRLGFAGMTLEEGARAALAAGKKGSVQYSFQWPAELDSLIEAFKVEEATVQESEGTITAEAKAIMESFAAKETDIQEALMRLGCLILKARGQFLNLWKERQDLALIRVPNAGKTATRDGPRGSKIVSNPGYRAVSLNASEGTRKEMKL